jgi:hypothetical protein
MSRVSLLAAVALVACVAFAGCGGGPVATPFSVAYPAATTGADAVPISLIDQTGLVTGMAVAEEAAAEGVSAVPGKANVLRASWAGGVCDDRATLVLNKLGTGYELAIHNHPRFTAGIECDASAVLRAVDITFAQPINPAALSLNIEFP